MRAAVVVGPGQIRFDRIAVPEPDPSRCPRVRASISPPIAVAGAQ